MNDFDDIATRAFEPERGMTLTDTEVAAVRLRLEGHRVTRPSRRRRRLLIFLAPALAVLAGVAYATIRSTTETAAHGIACVTNMKDDSAHIVGSDGREPAEVCGALWATGTIDGVARTPDLIACGTWVFPTNDAGICERKGLPASTPRNYRGEAKRFAAFQDAIVSRFTERCLGETEARNVIAAQLIKSGYVGWNITTGEGEHGEGFSSQRPCASLAIDAREKTVVVVPMARQGS